MRHLVTHRSLRPVLLTCLFLLAAATASVYAQQAAQPQPSARISDGKSVFPVEVWGRPDTQPASQPTTSPADFGKIRAMAIRDACAGKFESALTALRLASSASPGSVDAKIVKLLEDCLSVRRTAQAQRRDEFDQAVQRVRRSLLAEEHLPRLIEAGLLPPTRDDEETKADSEDEEDNNLRSAVDDAVSAGLSSDSIDAFESASADQAAKLKADADQSLAEAQIKLASAVSLLDGDDDPYASMFRKVANTLSDRLRLYRKGWASAESAEDIRELQRDAAETALDLGTLVAAKPWRIGLAQAERAKMLSPGKASLAGQDWYIAIKALAERRARQAVEDANWYDAMAAYSGLNDLEKDNEHYENQVKIVRRHVRVLALYGQEKRSAGATTKPAETRTTWQELVADVDARMVRSAITEISDYYVVEVDYRKISCGALEGVRILAETPQAAKSFPRLERPELRKKFVEAIERQKEAINNKDWVDGTDVKTALNAVLWASMRTVKIPVEVLAVEFAESMLDELDPFSSVIWPHDAAEFNKSTSGKFGGVGIQITKEPGKPLKVVTPLPGTPAFRLGIKSGDVIIAVDGQRTDLLSIDKLVRKITGEEGTRVVLTIERPGTKDPKDFTIIREVVNIRTVKGWRRLPDGDWDYMIDPDSRIGYMRVTQFTEKTAQDVSKVLAKLHADGMRSLVLDMRFNPGGLLQAATEIADQFLSSGRLVTTKGRPTRAIAFDAHPQGHFLDGDLIILVNRYSASASEIVSGAIKDWNRGMILGERTYGKGSVQHVIPIRGKKAQLRLTAAYYYLPSGRLLHRKNGSTDWGVNPDIEVSLTPKQTRRWLDLRRKTDLLQEVDPEQLTVQLERQFDADIQLKTALLLLRLMQLDKAKLAA